MVPPYLTIVLSMAATALSMPASGSGIPNTDIRAGRIGALDIIQCGTEELFVIEQSGRTAYRSWGSSIHPTVGCINKAELVHINAAMNTDSEVEVDDSRIRAVEFDAVNGPPPFPPQFTELWDNIQSQGNCGFAGVCEESLSVPNNIGPPFFAEQLVMTVRGDFRSSDNAETQRQYFQLARDAFDQTVQAVDAGPPESVAEEAAAFLGVSSSLDRLSGTGLIVEFSIESGNGNEVCSAIVEGIGNFFGGFGPAYLGGFFGLVGADIIHVAMSS
ncbi:hypothetical protein Q7P35_007992 [Cladosporium inversicolor]